MSKGVRSTDCSVDRAAKRVNKVTEKNTDEKHLGRFFPTKSKWFKFFHMTFLTVTHMEALSRHCIADTFPIL